MDENKRNAQEVGAKIAEAVMWLVFVVIGIAAIATALRVGLWILGVQQ